MYATNYKHKRLDSQHCWSVEADINDNGKLYPEQGIGMVAENYYWAKSYPEMNPDKGEYTAWVDDRTDDYDPEYKFFDSAVKAVKWVISEHKKMWRCN